MKPEPYSSDREARSWKKELRESVRNYTSLVRFHPGLSKRVELEEVFEKTISEFRFASTPYYLGLANPDDPNDPILRQILPDARELIDPYFSGDDPLCEESHSPIPGMVHRYPDRLLLFLNSTCPVYCRFCTRKRKVLKASGSSQLAVSHLPAIQRYLEDHPEIIEVVLSGGEPLLLNDRLLDQTLALLKQRKNPPTIRIHSRIPVVLPSRITDELSFILKRHFPVTFVTHFNHPVEITEESEQAIRRLRMAGVSVLNQSVLLKGVNDSLSVQETLIRQLNRIGIHPYYLHQCDEVKSVSHFRCDFRLGPELLSGLRGRNPGHLLPRFMIDLPGGGGKIPLEKNYRVEDPALPAGVAVFQNYEGREFTVVDPTASDAVFERGRKNE